MKSEFDMANVHYPYGVLHDQSLKRVSAKNNEIVFTFDIDINENDYEKEIFDKYKNYKQCDMTVTLNDEPFNYFEFVSSINKKGKFKGLSLNRGEFINAINNAASAMFVSCSATYGEFKIELCVYYNKTGKYKKFAKYDMCNITLDAKKIIWDWH